MLYNKFLFAVYIREYPYDDKKTNVSYSINSVFLKNEKTASY